VSILAKLDKEVAVAAICLPLSDFFGLLRPRYILGTTYTMSLAFFEALVYPEIDRTDLRRCLILCDRTGFQRATVEASGLRGASREYMAVCTPATGSFHPKVWILIEEDKAALLVGSGNLTQSGFMGNVELFDGLLLEEGGPNRAVAEDLSRFLSGLRSLWSETGDERLLAVDALNEMQEALSTLVRRMPEDTSPTLRFLSNFERPLVQQFSAFFERGGTLHVAAPYFGGSPAGVSTLRSELRPKKVKVFPAVHAGDTVDVPVEKLTKTPGVSVHPLKLSGEKVGFAHLKLYGFDSAKGQWLFTTSANCTQAALGGRNVEAGLIRKVNRADLHAYFAPADGEEVPTEQYTPKSMKVGTWLLLWATSRGESIELLAGEQRPGVFPLREVHLALQLGNEVSRCEKPSLFTGSRTENLPWSLFPAVKDRLRTSALLRVRGRTAGGAVVEGAAFVDHPFLLTSDPLHRGAYRATLALLDPEGLPEAADLANVFTLITGVFDAEEPPIQVTDGGGRHSDTRVPGPIPEKVPIWPPVADSHLRAHFPRGSTLQGVHWFQRVLTELLRSREEGGREPGSDGNGKTDEEKGKELPAKRTLKVAQSVWDHAQWSFNSLLSRLENLAMTAVTARKIWPVSIAILLVTLASRRQAVRYGDLDPEPPPVGTLIGQFLRALFADRSQPWRHGLEEDWDHAPTEPSAAFDLQRSFGAVPTDDLADVLLLLFAALLATAVRVGAPFPLGEWLLFRDIAGARVAAAGPDREHLTAICERYLAGDAQAVTWEGVTASLEQLQKMTWETHLGFQELRTLQALTKGKQGATAHQLRAALRDLWPLTERRLRAKKQPAYEVKRFVPNCCPAQDCSSYCVHDPKKRALQELRPVICTACGAILIPDRLAQAFKEWHDHVSRQTVPH
jgi:hypothetical protein